MKDSQCRAYLFVAVQFSEPVFGVELVFGVDLCLMMFYVIVVDVQAYTSIFFVNRALSNNSIVWFNFNSIPFTFLVYFLLCERSSILMSGH